MIRMTVPARKNQEKIGRFDHQSFPISMSYLGDVLQIRREGIAADVAGRPVTERTGAGDQPVPAGAAAGHEWDSRIDDDILFLFVDPEIR